jgi:hypothetical protein
MNLDELKDKWAEQDRKLDRILRLNESAVREMRFSSAKSSLRRLTAGIVVELVILAIGAGWLGNFIAEHLREPKLIIPALLLDLGAIALVSLCVRQLIMIGNLDYSGPLVAVQKELEKLRILRIRTTKWTFLAGCVLWEPALVVLAPWIANLSAWIAANVLFGIAVAVLITWISKRYADRLATSSKLKSLMDDLAGRSLMKAMASLDSIAQFEQEPQ